MSLINKVSFGENNSELKDDGVEKKYKLTEEKHRWYNAYRIEALKDFADVKKGDLGGFVQDESNLSHEGNCWVYNEAIVVDNALVRDEAKICNHGIVSGNAKVFNKAVVYNNARVYENATVKDEAKVFEDCYIYGNAVICENAKVRSNAHVSGSTVVSGGTSVFETIDPNDELIIDLGNFKLSVTKESNYCLKLFKGDKQDMLLQTEENNIVFALNKIFNYCAKENKTPISLTNKLSAVYQLNRFMKFPIELNKIKPEFIRMREKLNEEILFFENEVYNSRKDLLDPSTEVQDKARYRLIFGDVNDLMDKLFLYIEELNQSDYSYIKDNEDEIKDKLCLKSNSVLIKLCEVNKNNKTANGVDLSTRQSFSELCYRLERFPIL